MNSHLRQDGNIETPKPVYSKDRLSMTAKEVVLYALLASLLLVVQVSLAFLPNIELVSVLLIVYTRVMGRRTLIPLYVFVLVEGLIYGFGIWWINYLYIWTILVIAVILLRKVQSVWFWAVFSCIYGLCFGTLSSIPYFFMGGIQMAVTYILNGIPFDLLHGAGNFATTLVLVKPLHQVYSHIYAKYYNTVSKLT